MPYPAWIRSFAFVVVIGALIAPEEARSGGGVILQNDVCVITIGFYTAHFTAYQPQTRGNTEYCEDLPDTGETIFVLDYLHGSLKEVPVSFRIIRDDAGLGTFTKWEDIAKLGNLDPYTVHFSPPRVEPSASFRVSHDFAARGDYIGIATAGHPTDGSTYAAVFPFRVGRSQFPLAPVAFLAVALLAGTYLFRMNRIGGEVAKK
jgi:hypothetical protein